MKTSEQHFNTPLHRAVESEDVESIQEFILEGFDPDVRDSQGKTAFDLGPQYFTNKFIGELLRDSIDKQDTSAISNILYHYRHLSIIALEHATSIDDNEDLINFISDLNFQRIKPSQRQLDQIIETYGSSPKFTLSSYLDEFNYTSDLSGLYIDGIRIGEPKILNLSNLDLQYAKIHNISASERIIFDNSDLTNANISILNKTSPNISFANATIVRSFIIGAQIRQCLFNNTATQQTMIIGSKFDISDSLTDDQRQKTIDFTLAPSSIFNQASLVNKSLLLNQWGVCFGLCIELARHIMMSRIKGEEQEQYISKLQRKLINPSVNFIYRVKSYQSITNAYANSHSIDLREVGNNNFMASLPHSLNNSDIIGCTVSTNNPNSSHIFSVIKIRDKENNITGYKIFDPNFGEVDCLDIQSVNQQVHLLYEYYQQGVKQNASFFQAIALDDLVKECGLIHPAEIEPEKKLINKQKKYSQLSMEDKFYMRILNNKPSDKEKQEIASLINSMTPQQINKVIHLPNDKSTSLLHLAIEMKNKTVVSLLLGNGAHCNFVDRQNRTPLDLAMSLGETEIIKDLIKSGANPNIEPNDNFLKIMLNQMHCNDQILTSMFKEAIKEGDINSITRMLLHNDRFKEIAIDESGQTLFSYAIKRNRELIPELVKLGFDSQIPEERELIEQIKTIQSRMKNVLKDNIEKSSTPKKNRTKNSRTKH